LVSGGGAGPGVVRWGRLDRIKAAIASATPAAPAEIVRIGNSTTVGAGSGVTGNSWGTNAHDRNCSGQFVALANAAAGVGTNGLISNDSQIANSYTGHPAADFGTYFPRMSFGSGWQFLTSTFGGFCMRADAGATGACRYTLIPGSGRRIRLIWFTFSQISVRTDVNDFGMIPAGTANQPNTTWFNIPDSATYIEFYNNTSTWLMHSITAYNATQKVNMLNAGFNGRKLSDYVDATAYYSSLNVFKYIAPKLTVICGSINDATVGTLKLTFRQQLVTLVEAALLSGDCALEMEAISSDASSTDGKLWDIQDAMQSVADEYNLTLLSLPAVLGGYAQANAAGDMFDLQHPTYQGYGKEAAGIWLPLWNKIKS